MLVLVQGVRLLPPALHDQVGGSLASQGLRRACEARAELVEVEAQQTGQADDAGLREKDLLGIAKVGQVQQQRLVAPRR